MQRICTRGQREHRVQQSGPPAAAIVTLQLLLETILSLPECHGACVARQAQGVTRPVSSYQAFARGSTGPFTPLDTVSMHSWSRS